MTFNFKSSGVLWLLLVTGLLIAVGYWSWSSSPAAPIRIGLAVNLSGRGGAAGEHVREGALLAAAEVNAAGGINGRPLEILVSDDLNTREGIIASDRELLKAGVLAIIGHVTSNSSLIAYPEITSRGVLMFNPYTSTLELTGRDDLFIRTSVDTQQYARAMSDLLVKAQADSVIFLMDMSNPSFVSEYADLTIQNYPGRTKQIRFHPEEGVDWGSILAEIQVFNPDAVVLLTEVSMTGIAAQKLRQNGYTNALLATIWAQTDDLMRFGGVAVEGISIVTFVDPDIRSSEFLEFKKNLQARAGKTANARSTRAYEAVTILVQALQHCNRLTTEELKKQLLAHEYSTLLGKVEFDSYGDVVRDLYEVKVKDGRFIKAAQLK